MTENEGGQGFDSHLLARRRWASARQAAPSYLVIDKREHCTGERANWIIVSKEKKYI
jgi:hypothetical protein